MYFCPVAQQAKNLSAMQETQDMRFDPWVRKIPWRRDRLPTPVFWPGEFHGQSMGSQRINMTERLSLHFTGRSVDERAGARAVILDHEVIQPVQSLSRVCLFATPWTAACQASLSITNSQSLLKLISIESMIPFNHLIL